MSASGGAHHSKNADPIGHALGHRGPARRRPCAATTPTGRCQPSKPATAAHSGGSPSPGGSPARPAHPTPSTHPRSPNRATSPCPAASSVDKIVRMLPFTLRNDSLPMPRVTENRPPAATAQSAATRRPSSRPRGQPVCALYDNRCPSAESIRCTDTEQQQRRLAGLARAHSPPHPDTTAGRPHAPAPHRPPAAATATAPPLAAAPSPPTPRRDSTGQSGGIAELGDGDRGEELVEVTV